MSFNGRGESLPPVFIVDCRRRPKHDGEDDLLGRTGKAGSPGREAPRIKYLRDVHQHVLCPMLARYQRDVLSLKLSGGEWSGIQRPELPVIPSSIPPRWQDEVRRYMPLFESLKGLKTRDTLICGDTGVSTLFAFPPFDCIDVCTYYGGSIPLAVGGVLSGHPDVWAVTGDYAFVAAGQMGLLEAASIGVDLKILLLHNGRSETTGGQPIAKGALERVLAGYKPVIKRIENTKDAGKIRQALTAAREEKGLSLILAEYAPT